MFEQDEVVVSISQNGNEEDDMILRVLRLLGKDDSETINSLLISASQIS